MTKNHTANDTSTQAMTEVALGLSMAFFSLLILALLSMSVGNGVGETQAKNVANDDKQSTVHPLPEGERLRLSASSANQSANEELPKEHNKDKAHAEPSPDTQFVFHFANQYFDTNLQTVRINNIEVSESLVVAVLPELSFSEVMLVHADFAPQQIQITAMDKNWQRAFEQLNHAK